VVLGSNPSGPTTSNKRFQAIGTFFYLLYKRFVRFERFMKFVRFVKFERFEKFNTFKRFNTFNEFKRLEFSSADVGVYSKN